VPKHRSPLGVGREALLIVDHYEKYGRLRPDGRRLKQGSYELFWRSSIVSRLGWKRVDRPDHIFTSMVE
jgi:hypothetical protein